MTKPESLSYALSRKTDKLLKTHKNRNRAMTAMILIGAIAGLLWVYFIGNLEDYLNQWSSIFSGYADSANILRPVEDVSLIVLLIVTFAFVYVFAVWNRQNEKHRKLKEEILQILELKPCYHREPCSCNDEYCQWLEQKKGVDLF